MWQQLNNLTKRKGLVIWGLITTVIPGSYWFLFASNLTLVPVLSGLCIVCLAISRKRKLALLISLSLVGWVSPIISSIILNRSVDFLFIIPDNYYGEISITKYHDSKTEINKINGKYILDFSKNLNLTVQHEPIFKKWMSIKIINSSGELLADMRNENQDNKIIFEQLGTTPGSTYSSKLNGSTEIISSTNHDGTTLRWNIAKKRIK